ncbi:MAG TPA: lysophospholipid acyltransferase family protein [Microthrixaceae bacterium]|nr:1-acyl-sn-glycerol-3-phosphate acyltransferase [Microthrixaceae bacterium]HNI36359.1 lysophospholipid acyltransferase family protein [Microthrixaceae bacterium]
MSVNWRHPGRSGVVIYSVIATVIAAAVGVTSRVQVAKHRGRSELARRLPGGPVIVISNHTSLADGLLLIHACRRQGRSLRMLAAKGVFRIPLVGSVMRRLGFIPVARGTTDASSSLDAAAEALAHGEAVGLYPEGRLTRDPAMWPERAKTGAVRLALRTGAPIVPVAMVGAHEVVGRRLAVLGLVWNLIRRPNVEVSVGAPVDVLALANGRREPPKEVVREIADVVMAELIELVGDLRDAIPAHPTGVPREEPAP